MDYGSWVRKLGAPGESAWQSRVALRELGSLKVRFLNVQEFPVVALINPYLAVGSVWISCAPALPS
jgi:hypothetical protein